MPEVKVFEIRDRATYIKAMAIKVNNKGASAEHEMKLIGKDWAKGTVFLTELNYGRFAKNPFDWGYPDRTMFTAHEYIIKNFDELEPGQIIDVEVILGEIPVSDKAPFGKYKDEEAAK